MIATREQARVEYESLCKATDREHRRAWLYMQQTRAAVAASGIGFGCALLDMPSAITLTASIVAVLMAAHAGVMLRRCARAFRELTPRWVALRETCDALNIKCVCGECANGDE